MKLRPTIIKMHYCMRLTDYTRHKLPRKTGWSEVEFVFNFLFEWQKY